jgi:cobalamin biosynthesis Mg chelatase CobN
MPNARPCCGAWPASASPLVRPAPRPGVDLTCCRPGATSTAWICAALPTEAAWDLGRRSAELLLELHLQEEGEPLRTLALTVWGTATMRNGGEDIAQALALLGVRPVWDGPTRRLVDLEVIPLSLLGRPRVDVTLRISGLFRDAFPSWSAWFNQAGAPGGCSG